VSARPSRATTFHSTGWLTRTPCAPSGQARGSRSLASGWAAICARMASASGASRSGRWLRRAPDRQAREGGSEASRHKTG
jgi:hypothetical protein